MNLQGLKVSAPINQTQTTDLNSWRLKLVMLLLLTLIYVLAWQLQDQLILNYDVSWLMHAARRLLAGGTYSQDFFETNPPLILYLYFPPVVISKLFNANIILIFRAYVFLLASISLGICSLFVRQIFTSRDLLLARIFTLTLAFVFLILPFSSFGQRDHLVVLLALPYLLMLACRLQGASINPYYAGGIGLLAGLGFAIKPHFLIVPVLLEVYYARVKKSGLAWLRPETLTLLGFLAIYGASIFILQPSYVYVVAPYALRLYYSAMGQSWLSMVLHSGTMFCWFALLLYTLEHRATPHKALTTILFISLVGFLISFFTQRMLVYYHLIPLLSLATLLLVLLFASLISKLPRRWPQMAFILALGLVIFSFQFSLFYGIYSRGFVYKNAILSKLVTFMNDQAQNQSVYFLSTAGYYAFPTVDYTNTKIAPRFYFLWMAAGLANQEHKAEYFSNPIFQEQHRRDKNFFINMVADDLHHYQPRFIFVDRTASIFEMKTGSSGPAYLSDNAKFRREWQNYAYYTTIEKEGLFKLAVYQRRR